MDITLIEIYTRITFGITGSLCFLVGTIFILFLIKYIKKQLKD
jgi:hypothetical protein